MFDAYDRSTIGSVIALVMFAGILGCLALGRRLVAVIGRHAPQRSVHLNSERRHGRYRGEGARVELPQSPCVAVVLLVSWRTRTGLADFYFS